LVLGSHERGQATAVVALRGAGRVLDYVIRRLGYKTIRGSSSRGGMRALRRMVRTLRRGRAVVLAPDGPWGPAYRIKPGLISAAALGGAVIIPARYEATR